ncbi:MAG: peptidoglycan DD-metalloendopeptidase family protein, partial [Spirochaetales bacterium]|nr:peptidoglycan DD-metalloendopeptidase family protein [Spirochaetales bacterium]
VLLSSFCQNNGEGYAVGIQLSGTHEPVYPIASGEIVFTHEENSDFFSLPYGLGNFIALWHEGGIQSVYCQLKTGSLEKDVKSISVDESIGIVGDTGATIGGNLRLIIFNIEENEILNPIKNLIPFYEDTKQPVIQDIYIKRNNNLIQLKNDQVITPGNAEILISTYDLREDKQRIWEIAPYSIILFHNGQKLNQISFDAIREKNDKQVISGSEQSFDEIYEDDWMFKLGDLDFSEGKSHLQVKVSDFTGNTTTKELFIIAKKP